MRQQEFETHAALAPLKSTSTPGAARAERAKAGSTCAQSEDLRAHVC
jgi:hypothetical protein